MIKDSLGLVIMSAAAALILAAVAAGTYAFSAEPNARQPGLETNPSATSTINKNQAWPALAKPAAQHCRKQTCQNI